MRPSDYQYRRTGQYFALAAGNMEELAAAELVDLGARSVQPAYRGVYEAAAHVVGSTLDAVARVLDGRARRAFVPIAGLHHARRHTAGGFCVFNDCGVAIEILRLRHGIERIAYVDIDAHHGDGVFYEFEDDPELFVADIHEDGRFLYPGTGWRNETGLAAAEGTKLNLPLQPRSGDEQFYESWLEVEALLESARPEFVILQCGADGLAADPITHLGFSKAVHGHAARRLGATARAGSSPSAAVATTAATLRQPGERSSGPFSNRPSAARLELCESASG